MPNLFNADFLEFLKLLHHHKVEFILVGGYAVILHGYGRSTGDIDLWVNRTSQNYLLLKKVYVEFGAPIFSEEEFLSADYDVWSIGVEPRKIEILTRLSGIAFQDAYKNRLILEIKDIEVPYINFKDLIQNKKASGRLKDLLDIEELNKKKKP
jgi:hypothetical protein